MQPSVHPSVYEELVADWGEEMSPPWHNYGRAFSSDEAGDGPGGLQELGDWSPRYVEERHTTIYINRETSNRTLNPIKLPATWTTEYEEETDTLYYVDERSGWMQYTRPTSQLQDEEGAGDEEGGGNRELLRLPPDWGTQYHPGNIRHTFWNYREGRGQDDIPGEDMPRGWTYDYDWERDRMYFMHIQSQWRQWESPRGDLLPHTLLPGWEAVFKSNRFFARRPYFHHRGNNRSRFDIPGEDMPNGWTYEYDWQSSRVYYVNLATEWWQWEKPTISGREFQGPHRGICPYRRGLASGLYANVRHYMLRWQLPKFISVGLRGTLCRRPAAPDAPATPGTDKRSAACVFYDVVISRDGGSVET